MKTPDAIKVNNKLVNKVRSAINVALEYEAATNGKRKLGITGEVGEVLVCYKCGLELVLDSRSEGFNAIDQNGLKVQIKTRRSESKKLPSGFSRISRFSEHPFNYALLALLNHEYEIHEIWRADYRKLKPIIEAQKRRAPSVSSFINVGEPIFRK